MAFVWMQTLQFTRKTSDMLIIWDAKHVANASFLRRLYTQAVQILQCKSNEQTLRCLLLQEKLIMIIL